MTRTLREALNTGEPLFGAWLQMANPFGTEVTGTVGFDWVGIDTQHGMIGYESLLAMLQALTISRTPAIVRVSGNDAAEIGRVLDSGAQGVIVPLVETPEEAARAVAACRYAPVGTRSWGALRPALEVSPYTPEVGNDHAVCVVLVETVRGVANVDAIAATPGVDAVYIGPSDLAVSAGLRPMLALEDPEHRRLVERIAEACTGAGVALGTHPPGPEGVGEYLDLGFRLLAVYRDLAALRAGGQAALETARSLAAGAPASAGRPDRS